MSAAQHFNAGALDHDTVTRYLALDGLPQEQLRSVVLYIVRDHESRQAIVELDQVHLGLGRSEFVSLGKDPLAG